jgi:predicted metal-dependent enzyme (double-stranded beta helix superfamily)
VKREQTVVVFDVDALVADCVDARGEAEPRLAIRAVLERALAEPDAIADALQPSEGGLTMLHHTPDLTVIHIVWAPRMQLYPHDHRMWAAIGIYAGREDNAFFRRDPEAPRMLVDSGGKEIGVGDVLVLGDDVIHGVTNPDRKLTGAIHVYGGDFVNQPRSQWGPGPREERPHDMAGLRQHFADANRAWAESGDR